MRVARAALVSLAAILPAGPCLAHFQTLIPSEEIVDAGDARTISLDLEFTHPMEQKPLMEMARPKQFGVLHAGGKTDLREGLERVEKDGKSTWKAAYTIGAPGDYIFYVEPAPYWEPAERKMIVHYTKVVVDAFGEQTGWDAPVGFPVEIEPLTRPYGLWTGNLFTGVVKRDGVPVPFTTVEVEYWNAGNLVKPPSDPFVTQVVKADGRGVFSYAMPRAGWWAFAALMDGAEKMTGPDGTPCDVELGALIWVRCGDMK